MPLAASIMSLSHHTDHAPCGIGWRHPHYGELLESLPGLDFIEVHSENFFAEGGAGLAVLGQAREHYPVSLHGVGLGLGSACGIDAWHLDQLARLVERIEPVRVSDHACFARGTAAGCQIHAADLLPIAFNSATLDVMCANVQRVQDRLKRQLLVENLSAYLCFNSSDRDETTFLRELVQRTGCGLLVDVNNIYVNALNARLAGSMADPLAACLEWLDRIARGSVGELHLAGHRDNADIVIDDHGSRVCADVWEIYRHAQRRFGGVAALVEWDTDIPPLAVLLEEAARARNIATRMPQAVAA
ncbi:DUF692 domain-containing protein [Polaromonas sp. CT11-55]|uniref:DUF692 domain-containing protein n=1 Tax=Polaromonas sp. CT11-55 TaxID=3243045 RepID=UPI0039A5C91A